MRFFFSHVAQILAQTPRRTPPRTNRCAPMGDRSGRGRAREQSKVLQYVLSGGEESDDDERDSHEAESEPVMAENPRYLATLGTGDPDSGEEDAQESAARRRVAELQGDEPNSG
jgi:hypothetical protein